MDNTVSGSAQAPMDPNRRRMIRCAKMKSLRISVAIVATFLICWIPYHVMMVIFIFIYPDAGVSLHRALAEENVEANCEVIGFKICAIG